MIRTHREGRIAVVTMAHPVKRNALSKRMMQELIAAFRSVGESGDAAAVILDAEGPVFSAGHDLSEMRGIGLEEARRIFDICVELMETLQAIRQPVIAEVQGLATAAGCQLVATCDLAIASETASFATPGVKIGLFCTTPMVALTRAIGRKRAMEMLLTGCRVSAPTAAEWGLINASVAPEELKNATRKLAEMVADASDATVALGKRAFYRQAELPQAEAYAFAKETMSQNAQSIDAQEGICAFIEKRSPKWEGR